jgi:hypothetical protein
MSKYRFLVVLATVFVSVLLPAGCKRTTPPDAPSVPRGSTTGGIMSAYEFSSSAVDPGGDNIAIRFDWDDGDTSDWSALMPSGGTATASHAWADTGTFYVRAQARNMANAVSEWSAELAVAVTPGWTHTYGGTDLDDGRAVAQTDDGGYVIAGYTKSFSQGETDVYLVRTTSAGDTVWTRATGSVGPDFGRAVQPTADGGCIVVGEFTMGSNRQVWLLKFDSTGADQWDRFLGYDANQEDGSDVQQTSDGGYIIAGMTDWGVYDDDVFLVKTDASGNTVWYDDKGFDDSDERAFSIRQTSDGGYILTGTTTQYDSDGDVWLVKIGADGATTWYKHYGGSAADGGRTVRQTSDGGYIIAGSSASIGAGGSDFCLFKTDASGNLLWQMPYGGARDEWCFCGEQTADGGYILAGPTMSFGAGEVDYYLVKTDAQGNRLWERTFGGTGYDWCYSVQQTADGGYVLVGAANSYGAGSYDVYLVKTDAEGNCLP